MIWPGARPAPLPERAQEAVRQLLDDAARRGERWVSVARALFVGSMLARAVILEAMSPEPGLANKFFVGPPAELFAILFSLWMIWRTFQGPMPARLFALSVTVDLTVCFMSLLPNALWPYPAYQGVFSVPDSAALLLMIIISGFRLVPAVAWLAAGLAILYAGILVSVDHATLGDAVRYDAGVLALMTIFAGSCMAVSIAFASQTRRLVAAAARDSVRAEHAKRSLGALLQDHHDVRSLLSSANLNAQLLLRDADEDRVERARVERLHDDLQTMASFVSTLKERAFKELSEVEGVVATDIDPALELVEDVVRRRFPDVKVDVALEAGLTARIAGGGASLERVLLNLLVNACEGDGKRGAETIRVVGERFQNSAGPRVRIVVDDDGPGFSEAAKNAPISHAVTTKPEGSGLGLFLVQSVIGASDGAVSLGAGDLGGARVEVTLPAA